MGARADARSARELRAVSHHYKKLGDSIHGDAELEISRIEYTGSETTPPERWIDFLYQPLSERFQGYLAGATMQVTQALYAIIAHVGISGREYRIDYKMSPVTDRLRVDAIHVCDINATCPPPVTFNYDNTTPGLAGLTGLTARAGQPLTPIPTLHQVLLADINGDGKNDMVFSTAENGVQPDPRGPIGGSVARDPCPGQCVSIARPASPILRFLAGDAKR